MNETLHASLLNICTSKGDPLFHICYSGIVARKMLLVQSNFHCTNIHCLISIDVQQVSVNVNGCNFFHMEKFNCTSLLHPHSHVRCHSVRLTLCCHLSHGNKMQQNIGRKVQPLPPHHQHLPLMSWANIIK